jgi:hypothetical protein
MSSASAMNASIQNNRALQRKQSRAYFTERAYLFGKPSREKPFRLPAPSPATVRQLREKWAAEQVRQRRLMAVATLIALGLLGGLCLLLI